MGMGGGRRASPRQTGRLLSVTGVFACAAGDCL